MKVSILDYGMGNIGSIVNMIKKIGHQSEVIANSTDLLSAQKIILPGVGSFNRAVKNLSEFQLFDRLREVILSKKIPTLGICLGMQLLLEKSEEGNGYGLGVIKGEVRKFVFDDSINLRIPHMGWNEIEIVKESPLFKDLNSTPRFYFVHSYHAENVYPSEILTRTEYGINFISAIQKDNMYGVQFHPEKSHKFGMTLLKNFIENG